MKKVAGRALLRLGGFVGSPRQVIPKGYVGAGRAGQAAAFLYAMCLHYGLSHIFHIAATDDILA